MLSTVTCRGLHSAILSVEDLEKFVARTGGLSAYRVFGPGLRMDELSRCSHRAISTTLIMV